VLRELRQDVRGFWRGLASLVRPGETVTGLAELLVGRRMSGEPLLPMRGAPMRGVGPDPVDVRRNQFDYARDAEGLRCPLGAHVRRANPRTGDMPQGAQGAVARIWHMLNLFPSDLRADLVAASRFHRLLRRGREFGDALSWQQALRPDAPDPESGLHFICLNANIARQFEFVQNAWLSAATFAGLDGETDPLTGNREPFPAGTATDAFSIPQPNGIARRLCPLPRFVTVAGGAYFFLPGLRALRYFATPR
jgi:deferrochelatase/peroxidase EfeB